MLISLFPCAPAYILKFSVRVWFVQSKGEEEHRGLGDNLDHLVALGAVHCSCVVMRGRVCGSEVGGALLIQIGQPLL